MSKPEVKTVQMPPLDGSKYKLLVATINNAGDCNEYVKNAAFGIGWILGMYGIRAVSKTYDSYPISVARNEAVDEMLDDKSFTHLLFIDRDNVVPPMFVIQLLLNKVKVVSGWYLSRKGSGYPVVMYRFGKFNGLCNAKNFNSYKSYTAIEWNSKQGKDKKRPHLVRVDGCGAGCLLIARKAFKDLEKPYFFEDNTKFHSFGEDLWFSERLKQAKIPLYVDKRCFVGHIAWEIRHKDFWKALLEYDVKRLETKGLNMKTTDK